MAAPAVGLPETSLLEFVIIIVFILIIRIIRTIKGQRYSGRIFMLPFIYAIIMAVLLVYLTPEEIIISFVLALAAIPLGLRVSENPEFLFRNNVLYFKRSVLLTVIWLGGFIARIFLEIFFSTANNLVDFIVTALLAFTLGLIIGERFTIYRKGKLILQTGKIEENEEFHSLPEDAN